MKYYKQWKRHTLNTMLQIVRENNIKWGSFLSVDRLWFSWSFSPTKMDMIIRSRQCNDCNLDLGTGKTQGCVCQTINLVCCGNLWKETHKLLDPDDLCVVNSLKFSRVNPHTQSVNLKLEFSLSPKQIFVSTGTEQSSPMFLGTNSNLIKGQTRSDPRKLQSRGPSFEVSSEKYEQVFQHSRT